VVASNPVAAHRHTWSVRSPSGATVDGCLGPGGMAQSEPSGIGKSRKFDLSGRVDGVTFLQRISYITFGVRDMPTLRAFYAELGWKEKPASSDDFATYEVGGVLLALFPLGQLGQEAAPEEPVPGRAWNGITLGVNVESIEAVDETFRSALAAGARAVASPIKREWGGYSGYIADPEGNRWEIAWAPES
jgi:predicted lactoylglutathione lyase